MKFPVLAIAACFAAGILGSRALVYRVPHALVFCITAALFLIFGGSLLFFNRRHASAAFASLLVWCLLGAIASQIEPLAVPANHITRQIGANAAADSEPEPRQINLAQPLRWHGRLRSDPLRLPWGMRYEIDLDEVQSAGIWRPISGGLRASYLFNEREEQAEQEATTANSATADADTNVGNDPASSSGVGKNPRLPTGATDLPAGTGAILQPDFRAGDRVEVLMRAAAPRNFGDPGSFDYKTFLARQRIDLSGFVRNAALITRISGPPPTLAHGLARIRGRLLNEVNAMLAGDVVRGTGNVAGRAAVARAMLLGDRSFLDSEQVEAFQETGAYHVLVLAGLHIGILIAAFLWIGRMLRLRALATTCLVLGALAFYVALVQDRPPILRAALVATIYLLARLMFRRTALLNSVGVAALAILIVRPSELADPSFQLSFLAAFTIAGVAAPILGRTAECYRRALDHLSDATRDGASPPRAAQFRLDLRAAANWLGARLPRPLSRLAPTIVTTPCRVALRLWELFVISVAIQFGMLPVMAEYFHRISPVGVVANIPAVLLTTFIIPFGFLALGASVMSRAAGHVAGHVLSSALGALITSTDWFARTRWASFRVPSPPNVLLIAFFVVGTLFSAALLVTWRWPARVACGALLVLAGLIVAYPFSPRLVPGQLEVTVLDVGQGDSIFVAFPDGRTMLVDGGGLPGGSYIRGNRPGIDIGEDVVSSYLWSRGLKRIDVVALTHAHEDHLGGLPAVLRNFKVGQLWVGRDVDSANYRRLLSEAASRSVPVIHRVRGERFDWPGAQVRVLWPDNDDTVKSATNDDSLVLHLQDGGETFLLAGDIERPVERDLLSQQGDSTETNGPNVSADFLKVPHHGSKTSSTQPFLDAVHPRYAAISVGASNTFGHPNAEVVARITAGGARVFRTDRDGAITAIAAGNGLTVRSFIHSQSSDGRPSDDQSGGPPPLPPYRSSSMTSPDTSSRSSAPAR